MKRIQAQNYVIENGRFMPDAPETPYYVRFPNPYATTTFFSKDTDDLVEQVFKYANTTPRGRDMWKGHEDEYLELGSVLTEEDETEEE